jgi:hypothetical protein
MRGTMTEETIRACVIVITLSAKVVCGLLARK